jgi:hypothetical protein
MLTTFEIGKTYYQEFDNGDRVYFVPTERCKNGNWKGTTYDHYVGRRKPSKPKQVTGIWHPPLPTWKEANK